MTSAAQLDLFAQAPAPDMTEAEKRDAAMRRMMESEQRRAEIERRAKEARHLSHDPSAGLKRYGVPHAVTADMVNESLGVPVMRARTRTRDANNINGAIFTAAVEGKGRFVKLGQVRSARTGSHGRLIWAWCLADYEAIARPAFERARAA